MRYIARRALFYLGAAWAAITINFFIPRLMPGNPALIAVSRYHGSVSPAALDSVTRLFGLSHKPLYQQYFDYLGQLLHGQLGISLVFYPTPVSAVIRQTLPYTIALVGVTTIVSFVLGTLFGVLAAWRRGSWLDHLLPLTTFLSGIPYFWLALVLLYVFGVTLGMFPLSGAFGYSDSPSWSISFIGDALNHAFLPAASIVLASIASWLVGMRNNMLTTLGEDYVVLAEAKGLRSRRIMFTYAARNAVLPNVAGFAISLGMIVGGAILTEIVFSYPGIGYTLYQAVLNEDYPLMQAIFLIISLAVLAANFCADLVYGFLDPRARRGAA